MILVIRPLAAPASEMPIVNGAKEGPPRGEPPRPFSPFPELTDFGRSQQETSSGKRFLFQKGHMSWVQVRCQFGWVHITPYNKWSTYYERITV